MQPKERQYKQRQKCGLEKPAERVGEGGTREVSTKRVRINWARLLWRVWGVDALKCPACDGRMKMIAAVTERVGIVRILEHLGVSTEVPRMRRVRDGP